MKKRAKFVVEIEYDEADIGELSPESVEVITLQQEGDYKGMVLALTAGLLFSKHKDLTNLESYKIKLRMLRAFASSLVNGLEILKSHNAFGDAQMNRKEMGMVGTVIKHITDVISYGIARMLSLSEDDIVECNEEYRDVVEHNRKTEKDEKEGKRTSGRPSEEDFL